MQAIELGDTDSTLKLTRPWSMLWGRSQILLMGNHLKKEKDKSFGCHKIHFFGLMPLSLVWYVIMITTRSIRQDFYWLMLIYNEFRKGSFWAELFSS